MTRQKKELIKKLDYLDRLEEADGGFGYWDISMSEPYNQERATIYAEMAKLQHYDTVQDMFYDSRYADSLVANGTIPFN